MNKWRYFADSSTTHFARRRVSLLWATAISVFLGIILLSAEWPDKKTIWLLPSQVPLWNSQPGFLTALKYKIIDLIPPLRDWYRNRGYRFSLEAAVLSLRPGVSLPLSSAELIATNANCAQLWIVSLDKAGQICDSMKSDSGYQIHSLEHIQTSD